MSGCPDPGCHFFESGRFCDVHFRKSDMKVWGPDIRSLYFQTSAHYTKWTSRMSLFRNWTCLENSTTPSLERWSHVGTDRRHAPQGHTVNPRIDLLTYLHVTRLKQDNDRLAPNTPAFLPCAALSPRLHVGPTVGNSVGTWGVLTD